ncbi:MAG: aminopeptidase P family N-terminal domain-containing protein, partial [Gaiellaceae bacterium]
MTHDFMTGARVPREMVQERWTKVSEAMAEQNMEALLVAGRGQIGQYGNVFYLSGLLPFNDVGHTYVFLRRGQEAQIVAGKRDQVVADVYAVEDLIWHAPVADMPAIGTGASALAVQISELIDKHGLANDRIGIVGMSRMMPVADLEALRALQPDVEFVDADALLAPIKAVKSPEELELYKNACEIMDDGFDVLVETLRPGASEAEIAGAVEAAVRARGCLATIIHVLPGHVFTRPPTLRRLQQNEMIHGYVEAVAPNGY